MAVEESAVSGARPSVTAGQESFRAGRYREAIAAWKGLGGEDLAAVKAALAEAYFRLALEHHAACKEESALSFLQQAVALAPDKWIYRYHLGLTFHRLGNVRRAEQVYREVLVALPGHARVLFHLGLLVLQGALVLQRESTLEEWLAGPEGRQLDAGARRFLRWVAGRCREAPPSSEDANGCFLWGVVRAKAGDIPGALGCLARAVDLAPGNPHFWRALGEVQARAGDSAAAGESLGRALALGAGEVVREWLAANRQALVLRAAQDEDFDTVIRLWEEELGGARGDAVLALAHFCRGNRAAHEGRWEEARADWERALQLGPGISDLPDVLHNLALLYERRGNRQEAIRYWRRTISAWSALVSRGGDERPLGQYLALAYRRLADLLLEEGNLDEARLDLEIALRYDPADAQSQKDLVMIWLILGEEARAAQVLRQIVEQQPGDAEAVAALARIHWRLDEEDEALRVLRRGLVAAPDHPVLIPLLAEMSRSRALDCIHRRDLEGARRHVQEALRVAPDDPQTMSVVGVLAYREGHRREGDRWFEKALLRAGSDPQVYLILGVAQFMVGHPRKASGYLKKAMELSGYDAEICYQAGRTYLAYDRQSQAGEAFRRALDSAGGDRRRMYRRIIRVCEEERSLRLLLEFGFQAAEEFPDDEAFQHF